MGAKQKHIIGPWCESVPKVIDHALHALTMVHLTMVTICASTITPKSIGERCHEKIF